MKADLKEILQERASILEEEQQERFSQMAEMSLVENKLFPAETPGKKRTLASKRKGDLIKDILAIEVHPSIHLISEKAFDGDLVHIGREALWRSTAAVTESGPA